jgi:hypothetical protein
MINLILVEFDVLISSQISSDQAIRYMDIIAYALIITSNRPKRFNHAKLKECMYLRELGVLKIICSMDWYLDKSCCL